MSDASAHYSRGTLQVAFVLSAPGEAEEHRKRPAAGSTGENINSALTFLNSIDPLTFASKSRYDYRITNAWASVLSASRGDGRTEPSPSEVRQSSNVERVRSEVSGCTLLILCGDRPAILSKSLAFPARRVVVVSHIGNKALNRKYSSVGTKEETTPLARRIIRTEYWARSILTALTAANVA
jgi:uracil-DNA glycosylase